VKQFDFWKTREIFSGSDINSQDSYALLAVQNRQLAYEFIYAIGEVCPFSKKKIVLNACHYIK